MRGVTLLGATGSVGTSTLDVLRSHQGLYRLEAVAAGSKADVLAGIVTEFRPRVAALAAEAAVTAALRIACRDAGTELLLGSDAATDAAALPGGGIVVAAIVGAAGLPATAAAIRRGATVALANKEALVVGGEALTRLATSAGATLLPVDSEHAALHQCLRSGRVEEVRRLILTASGGPFRQHSAERLASVTVEEALNHPTWKMGGKISIDSSTLMNKGLELIEARWLFGLGSDRLDVVVHPQSIVHSLVEFRDGSVLAQLSRPDMRDPVRYCLNWPDRLEAPVASLDLAAISPLTFEPPDEGRFPALRLARVALEAGGAAPAVLNAANEVAVAAFLERRIGFTDIPRIIEACLPACARFGVETLESALATDREARILATEQLPARH